MRALLPTTPAGTLLLTRVESAVPTGGLPARRDPLAALCDAGVLHAALPVEAGGLGIDTAHDVLVAAVRIARGDADTTVRAHAHLAVVLDLLRRRRVAERRGHGRQAERLTAQLHRLGWRGIVADALPLHDGPAGLRHHRRLVAGALSAAAALGAAQAAASQSGWGLEPDGLDDLREAFDRVAHLVDAVDELDPYGTADDDTWLRWTAEVEAVEADLRAVADGLASPVALDAGPGTRARTAA